MANVMTVPTDRRDSLGQRVARRGLWILAVNTAGALLVTLLLGLVGSGWPFRINLVVSLIFANSIGTPAGFILAPLTRRFRPRGRAVQWLVLLAGLLAVTAVGSSLAGLILLAVPVVPPEQVWPVLSFGLRIAVPVTLGIGASMYLYERTRASLDATTLELRAKELERERLEKLAIEARLAALESRLHPHFLFNTLNAIHALIPEEPERADALLLRLAQLLRQSLATAERHTIPLGEELRIVSAYLEIEAARLGERLRYSIQIPEEALREVPVPPLALHTLVENSVKHVAAERRDGAELRVEGSLRDDRLVLGVWDDGPGFSLEEIPAGHGLDNLKRRLAALYGASASLEVRRGEAGTRVALSLPR
ncbi:MAG: sensor histidine kinase, partial [Dehalococcoidia bacterium]